MLRLGLFFVKEISLYSPSVERISKPFNCVQRKLLNNILSFLCLYTILTKRLTTRADTHWEDAKLIKIIDTIKIASIILSVFS